MSTLPVITLSKEDKKKERLKLSIEKKTAVLAVLTEELEMLTIELDFIAHEYNVRIGGLLLKDNQLDLEILQLQNLKELLKGGMSYEKAQKQEEEMFYSELLRIQQEQEKIDEEKKMIENIADVSEEVLRDIKTLWKKLMRKLHPDLVLDVQEKERREALVKKINKAYAESNIEVLSQIDNMEDVSLLPELSVDQLEEFLVKLENAIADTKGNLLVLQRSPWHEWKKKREKQSTKKVDIFAELEKKFLDDIVKKIEFVQKLREEVRPNNV